MEKHKNTRELIKEFAAKIDERLARMSERFAKMDEKFEAILKSIVLLVGSAMIIIAYIWLVFFPPLAGTDIFLLKLTGTVAVAGVFAILA